MYMASIVYNNEQGVVYTGVHIVQERIIVVMSVLEKLKGGN
jgi:hypothetical protein